MLQNKNKTNRQLIDNKQLIMRKIKSELHEIITFIIPLYVKEPWHHVHRLLIETEDVCTFVT